MLHSLTKKSSHCQDCMLSGRLIPRHDQPSASQRMKAYRDNGPYRNLPFATRIDSFLQNSKAANRKRLMSSPRIDPECRYNVLII